MAFRPAPDDRAGAAVVGGLALAVVMVGAGAWATMAGTPLLWLFVGPWAFVGVLLVVWGWQRRPHA